MSFQEPSCRNCGEPLFAGRQHFCEIHKGGIGHNPVFPIRVIGSPGNPTLVPDRWFCHTCQDWYYDLGQGDHVCMPVAGGVHLSDPRRAAVPPLGRPRTQVASPDALELMAARLTVLARQVRELGLENDALRRRLAVWEGHIDPPVRPPPT